MANNDKLMSILKKEDNKYEKTDMLLGVRPKKPGPAKKSSVEYERNTLHLPINLLKKCVGRALGECIHITKSQAVTAALTLLSECNPEDFRKAIDKVRKV